MNRLSIFGSPLRNTYTVGLQNYTLLDRWGSGSFVFAHPTVIEMDDPWWCKKYLQTKLLKCARIDLKLSLGSETHTRTFWHDNIISTSFKLLISYIQYKAESAQWTFRPDFPPRKVNQIVRNSGGEWPGTDRSQQALFVDFWISTTAGAISN